MLFKMLVKHRGMGSVPSLSVLQRLCTCELPGQIVLERCQERLRCRWRCTLLQSHPGHWWVAVPQRQRWWCQTVLPHWLQVDRNQYLGMISIRDVVS